jgi:hypothetical protein
VPGSDPSPQKGVEFPPKSDRQLKKGKKECAYIIIQLEKTDKLKMDRLVNRRRGPDIIGNNSKTRE